MHDKMAYADEPASLEYIQKSDFYPKKTLVSEDDSLQVPFPLLCGEAVEFLGRTSDGVIALSNFRILIRFKDSFINVPLGLVESVECRDIFFINIYCKDATVAKCAFSNNDSCLLWYKRLAEKVSIPSELKGYFAFAFHAWCVDKSPCPSEHEVCYQLCQADDTFHFSFGKEVERMKFNIKKQAAWRITYINENFGVSATYPKHHIVPASISDEQLKKVAGFRALQRFPSVVWRDQRNGAVLVRCSQPEVGWLGWRNEDDEALLKAIPLACAQNPGTYHNHHQSLLDDTSSSESEYTLGECEVKTEDRRMLVIDCRSYSAAFANRAKGGGLECPEYYPNCDIQFMNLANIHSIRKSFIALRTLCGSSPDQASWLSGLENTKWLAYIGSLMKTACTVANSINKEGRSVLVHCSDGWDRTPQIISLAELLLDPYYRTLEGFQCLIEREWLDYGHKFADRCGNGINNEDASERCPVFLQFLDCVNQVLQQFPCAFQFNEAYLVKMVQHTYSCLFGTFLCNNTKERLHEELDKRTASVFSMLNQKNKRFLNHLFSPTIEQQVLHPSCHIKSIKLWNSVYLSNNSLSTSPEELSIDKSLIGDVETGNSNLQKTRSCENLLAANTEPVVASPTRRRSDPNISKDLYDKSLQSAAKDSEQTTSRSSIPNGFIDDSSAIRNLSKELNGVTPENNEVTSNGELSSDGSTSLSSDQLCNGNHNGVNHDLSNGHIVETNGISNGNSSETSDTDEKDVDTCHNLVKADSQLTLKSNSFSSCISKVESSTDTLCGDDLKTASNQRSVNCDDGHCDSVKCPTVNGNCDVMAGECCNRTSVNKLKTLESSSSISTSTSDISSSHINGCLNDASSLLKLQCILSQPGPLRLDCSGTAKLKSVSNGGFPSSPLYPTPVGSRTPNSTCPPTPGTDSRSSESQKHLNGIGRHLDIDGLTIFNDPVQQRMSQMEMEYERQIEVLRSHLAALNTRLLQHASACSGAGRCALEVAKEDYLSYYTESNGNEYTSLGSNAASDVSWEQIDESESRLIKWIPDHAVTHCANCDTTFGLISRKHHCRNCGNVFCHECTNHYTTIPQQNLMTPERVCQRCYKALRHQNGKHLETNIIDDRPLAAAASN